MKEKASSVTKMSSVNCGQGQTWSSSNRKIAELCWRFFFYIFLLREIYMVLYERKNSIQIKGGIIMLNLITLLLGAAYITMNVIDAGGLR